MPTEAMGAFFELMTPWQTPLDADSAGLVPGIGKQRLAVESGADDETWQWWGIRCRSGEGDIAKHDGVVFGLHHDLNS